MSYEEITVSPILNCLMLTFSPLNAHQLTSPSLDNSKLHRVIPIILERLPQPDLYRTRVGIKYLLKLLVFLISHLF